jgi:hypothetical protein
MKVGQMFMTKSDMGAHLSLLRTFSRSLLHEILSKHLGYKKNCARWVPRMLADGHRKKRMGAALTFLERYHRDGSKFLDHIVTGDETWVSHFTPESKR